MTVLFLLALLAQNVPAQARQHLENGFALARKGDFRAAEKELRVAVKLAPDDPQALAILGIALSQQGRIAEAIPFLERASRLAPNDVNTRYNLALNQARLGQTATARLNAERVLREQPGYQPAAELLATLKSAQGYESALQLYSAGRFAESRALLECFPNRDAGTLRLLAWCHQREGHPVQAMAILEEAIALAPADPVAYTNAGQMLLEQDQATKARQAAAKALALGQNYAPALKLDAMLDLKAGDLKRALASFTRAATLDPNDPEAVERVGTILRLLFRPVEARATLARALVKFPRYARLYAAQGQVLLDPALAEETKAEALFEAALALDPTLADAHLELGKLQLDSGRAAEGRKHLEAALRLEEWNPAIPLALARAYQALGLQTDHARALETYRKLKR